MTASLLLGTGLSAMTQAQSGNLTVTPHPDTQPGDRVLVACSVADSASANWSISGGSGTWATLLASGSVGTGKFFVFSKVFAAGDTTYTLSRTGSDAYRIIPISLPGSDPATDPIVGSLGTRAASGGAFATTAPSITTVEDDTLALLIAYERTTASDGAVTVNNGFTVRHDAHTVGGDNLQALFIASKEIPTAGAVGATTATFTNSHGTNSAALLIGIAPSDVAPPSPASGCIGARVATSVTHGSITIGVDRIQGSLVEVAAKLGATQVARQTVSIDPFNGWGSTTFTGLIADAPYGFEFYVDGVLQTDTGALIRTHPTPGTPTSFTYVAGSCQFTGSNHPVWDRIIDRAPRGIAHMGDLHYADATTVTAWRLATEQSLTAPRFRAMLGLLPLTWTWDNHDRIILDGGGPGGVALNLGKTLQTTNTEWRKLAGADGWSSPDTAGRTWVVGRVRFVQTDQWTVRDDPDAGGTPPLTFLGAAQKAWFKATLEAATEEVIVWLCQWTGQNHANGRWNSFPQESSELEAWIEARPELKAKMVMIGGDSHSLQVTDGSRTAAQGQRFPGIPNYNISGFNRSSDAGQGGAGWLIDKPLRVSPQLEADWGGYSLITVTDEGGDLTFRWDGVRVNAAGVEDIMYTQTLVFEPPVAPVAGLRFIESDGTTEKVLTPISWDGTTESVLTPLEQQ